MPMGALIGLAVFVACLVAGGILLGTGHVVIGFVVLLCSLPGAIVGWIKWNDRSYTDEPLRPCPTRARLPCQWPKEASPSSWRFAPSL